MRRLAIAVDLLLVLVGAVLGLATNYLANENGHRPGLLHFIQDWSLPIVAGLIVLLVGGRFWQISLERPRQPASDWDPRQPPYPGLEPFAENEASTFFGRETEIRMLYERLHPAVPRRSSRLVPVVGPSGCGKSSLVQAGLLPRLAARRGHWVIVPTMVPADRPLRSLALALAGKGAGDVETVHAHLTDAAALNRMLEQVRANASGRAPSVLLVIDQAEELFTLCAAADREAFLSMLTDALHANQALWVILVMRTEFLADFLSSGYGALVRQPVAIGTLGRSALIEVIERPAARAGLRFEPPSLPHRMADDTGSGDALPLLAYTLHQLWQDARSSKVITERDYERIGGVAGALTRRANEVTDQLQKANDPEEPVLTTLIKFVSTVGTTPTRRRVRRDALDPAERRIVDAFVAARLLTVGVDPETGQAVVSVAHEALIDHWAPLRQAVEARMSDLQAQARLERWTTEWLESGRDNDYLLSGERLHAAQRWLEADQQGFADLPAVHEYVQGSANADHATMIRMAQASAAQALDSMSRVPELAMTAAVTAIKAYAETPLAYEVLIAALAVSHLERILRGHAGALTDAAWSPDGLSIATAARDGSVQVWSSTGTAPMCSLPGGVSPVRSISWAPDSARLAMALADGSVLTWDVKHAGTAAILARSSAPITMVAWSPDGTQLASAGEDGVVCLWRADTGERLTQLPGREGPMYAVSWSPDGTQVAGASAEWSVLVWDATGAKPPQEFTGHEGPVRGVVWSPDGRQLASASDDWSVRVWDTVRQVQTAALQQHDNSVLCVAWSADGARLASSGADGLVIVWNGAALDTPGVRPLMVLRGHDGPACAVAWSPDRSHLVSASTDGSARLWNANLTVLQHGRLARAVAWSPDNQLVAATSCDRSVQIWDAASGDAFAILGDPGGDVTHLAWSPDSRELAWVGRDRLVRIWNVTARREVRALSGQNGQGQWVTWCPNGSCIASASIDCTVRIWRADDGTERAVLRYPVPVTWVGWSPDHSRLAVTLSDGNTLIEDFPDGGNRESFRGHDGDIWAAAWSAEGTQIATGSYDRKIKIWDAATGSEVAVLHGHEDAIFGLAWSPVVGGWLASVGRDQAVRLWDVPNAREVAVLRGHEDVIWGVGWSPDGKRLATSSDDGVVRLWDVSIGYETALAEVQRLGLRPLSADERRRFLLPVVPNVLPDAGDPSLSVKAP